MMKVESAIPRVATVSNSLPPVITPGVIPPHMTDSLTSLIVASMKTMKKESMTHSTLHARIAFVDEISSLFKRGSRVEGTVCRFYCP